MNGSRFGLSPTTRKRPSSVSPIRTFYAGTPDHVHEHRGAPAMNAAAWIALATLAFFVLVQAVTYAFVLGGLFQRVKALEARKDGSDCTAALAAMEATLRELKGALDQRIGSLEETVRAVTTQPIRTRRSAQ